MTSQLPQADEKKYIFFLLPVERHVKTSACQDQSCPSEAQADDFNALQKKKSSNPSQGDVLVPQSGEGDDSGAISTGGKHRAHDTSDAIMC